MTKDKQIQKLKEKISYLKQDIDGLLKGRDTEKGKRQECAESNNRLTHQIAQAEIESQKWKERYNKAYSAYELEGNKRDEAEAGLVAAIKASNYIVEIGTHLRQSLHKFND